MQSLFQPTSEARPAFDLGLRLATTSGSLTRRLLQAGVLILKQDWRFLLGASLAGLAWVAVAVLAIVALLAGGAGTLEVLAAILLGLVALPVAALIVGAFAAGTYVRFGTKLLQAREDTWWGMCSGRTEAGRPAGAARLRPAGRLRGRAPRADSLLHGGARVARGGMGPRASAGRLVDDGDPRE